MLDEFGDVVKESVTIYSFRSTAGRWFAATVLSAVVDKSVKECDLIIEDIDKGVTFTFEFSVDEISLIKEHLETFGFSFLQLDKPHEITSENESCESCETNSQ